MDMGFPAERTYFFQVSIKLAQPFPAPELRTRILRPSSPLFPALFPALSPALLGDSGFLSPVAGGADCNSKTPLKQAQNKNAIARPRFSTASSIISCPRVCGGSQIPKGPKIEKIQDRPPGLKIFNRDWNFQASHPANPYFCCGEFWRSGLKFSQSRLKIFNPDLQKSPQKNRGLLGGSLEIFNLDWNFHKRDWKFQSRRAIFNFFNLWALRDWFPRNLLHPHSVAILLPRGTACMEICFKPCCRCSLSGWSTCLAMQPHKHGTSAISPRHPWLSFGEGEKPWPSFPCFFWISLLFCFSRNSLLFGAFFPSFPRNFGVRQG